ncbi:MAG: transcription-repair coupling factor [bacterium]
MINYLKENSYFKYLYDKNRISKSNDNFNTYLIVSDYLNNNRNIFVVTPSLFLAQKYYDNLLNIIDPENVLFFPCDDIVATSFMISSNDFKFERINTIKELTKDNPKIIVTNFAGITKYNIPLSTWKQNILTIRKEEIDRENFINNLVTIGYKKTYTVYKTGEFAVRGSIIDIFPLNYQNPIRLDFFGDEIDDIKEFDITTQLSINKLDTVEIIPVTEFFYTNEQLKEITIEDDNDSMNIALREKIDSLTHYIPKFYKPTSIINMIEAKTYILDIDKMNAIYQKSLNDLSEYLNQELTHKYFFNIKELVNDNMFYIDGVVSHENQEIVSTKEIDYYNGNFRILLKDIKNLVGVKHIFISINDNDRIKRIKELLLDNSINYQTITSDSTPRVDCINLITGYVLPLDSNSLNVLILNETALYTTTIEKKRIKYKSIFSNSTKISKHDELKINDYIVHYDYGIGQYIGIKVMEMNGKFRDYLQLKYFDTDVLYIPIEKIDKVQKYNVIDGREPALTKLGSSAWTRTKKRVLEKVKETSEKLIKLYAQRSKTIGYQYSKDDELQIEFENTFGYDLTEDQYKAIVAVKEDMESTKPMDRLICGDVGFGKTEVALRAAFKAIMDKKQVAYLAPTTLLTRQHYYTFKTRMSTFGINVELLNRFVSPKRVKEILLQLEDGSIDCVIGTHRLLSHDIKFKDLGLLITDEEQRFGVTHKERIKEMKLNIDSLTLTATPIPRTLQMSIMGIKDLSTIETPPKNRYPVQTYVTPRNDAIIKEAIERELIRGGQVFYMYNFKDDIIDIAAHINKLVPEAKIVTAHGSMSKNDLEDTITDFIDKKYDVLVCTTIIETGIDIPDTNTLLIHDSDRLGLSQLYQLRGRVGRSDKIAYAYLMYDPKKILSENSTKRLESIQEFTELGSGYQIAMQDLAIRGAGDVLGEEQSGFMDNIGIELYLKILNDSLKELRNPTPVEEKPTYSQVYSNRTINPEYINNEDAKLEIHNKIRTLTSINNLTKLQLELEDRFGKFDNELLLYMYEKLFFNLCSNINIETITDTSRDKRLTINEITSSKINPEELYKIVYDNFKNINISYSINKFIIQIDLGPNKDNSWLFDTCKLLDKINKELS